MRSWLSDVLILYFTFYFHKLVFAISEFPNNLPDNASFIDFSYQPENTVLLPSESLLLNCEIRKFSHTTAKNSGALSARISWFENNRPIAINETLSRTLLLLSNGSLFISANTRRPAAEGLYKCLADYQGKILVSQSARVQIAEFSSSSTSPLTVAKCLSSTANFDCSFTKTPPFPIVSWYKNKQLIGRSTDYRRKSDLASRNRPLMNGYVVLPNGTLEISNISFANSGMYSCRGQIETRIVQSNRYRLSVTSGCSEEQVYFTTHPTPTTANVGDATLLPCSLSRTTADDLRWFKNGEEITFRTNQRYRRLGQGNLVIDNVRRENDALFSCKLESDSFELTTSARLTVLEPPQPLSSIDHLRTVHYGCEVALSCDMTGTPKPAITWYKDGQAVTETAFEQLQDDVLLLKRISDGGMYQCFAENEAGRAQIAYQLLFIAQGGDDRRAVPWNSTLELSSLNPRSADIAWSAFRLFQPSAYRVTVMDDTDHRRFNFESDEPRFKVKNLKPNHRVSVHVTPQSPLCDGPSSKVVSFIVPSLGDREIGTVQALAVEPMASSILVTWSPPANQNRAQLRYEVIKETIGSPRHVERVSTSRTSYEFLRLPPYTRFRFQVAVVEPNGEQLSLSEQISTETLEADPERPPSDISVRVEGAGTAVVSWTPPSRDDVNGPIVGYRIRYKDLNIGKMNTAVTSPNAIRYVLTGLRKKTRYWLRIQVFNNIGSSPYSRRYFLETSRIVPLRESISPGRPELVNTRESVRDITLYWNPSRDGVHVTDYVIGWGESGPYEHTVSVSSSNTFYRITGLKPSTPYFISIRAKNAAGMGEEFHTDARTLEYHETQKELYPPLGLHVTVLTHTTLNVSWHDAYKNDADRYYVVRYKTNVPELPRVGMVNATDMTCILHGLRPHTVYEIAVRVIESSRKSAWSMTETAITNESRPGSPPTDLTVMPIDEKPTYVQLNWQPPVEPNGELTGYLIFYTTDRSHDISDWVVEPVIGGKLSTKIEGLTEDTQYYFKALARNAQGVSPYSDEVAYRTPNVEGVSEVTAAPKTMANWMWYVIIGAIALVVISIVIVTTVMICRNRRSGSKRSKGSGSIHRHSANGIRSASGESWPFSATSSQSGPSMKLHRPEEHFEMKSLHTNDGRFTGEYSKYRTNAMSSELAPLNGYPYASHSHHHGDMRSPITSESCQYYSAKGHYGNEKPVQLSNMHRSTGDVAQYDVSYRYPYNNANSPVQDYAVDSAYGSDHQHHHAVDDQLPSRSLEFASVRKHKTYENDRLPSDRSSPLTDSLRSTRGSRSFSDESVNIANVKDFLRTMQPNDQAVLNSAQ